MSADKVTRERNRLRDCLDRLATDLRCFLNATPIDSPEGTAGGEAYEAQRRDREGWDGYDNPFQCITYTRPDHYRAGLERLRALVAEEDALLARLDATWWKMTDEERAEFEKSGPHRGVVGR